MSVLGNKVCNKTMRNLLEKKGYKFLHSRKNRTNKNNGLEKEDESFLERLKGYLRRISGQGEYHSI